LVKTAFLYPANEQHEVLKMFGSRNNSPSQSETAVSAPRLTSQLFPSTKAHTAPKLELLDALVNIGSSKGINFKNTLFVGVQHILETTATLFQSLISLESQPERMFFSGKCYSTSPTVAEAVKDLGLQLMPDLFPSTPGQYQAACRQGVRSMWNRAEEYLETHKDVETIIIVDDGGRCLEEMPTHLRFKYKVAGIEQTRGGLYSPALQSLPFPLLEPATSAAKRHIESPFISSAIINRLKSFLPTTELKKDTIYGIIGNGAIGDAVVSHLLNEGHTVIIYDKDASSLLQSTPKEKFFKCSSIEALIENADCIFGCTGADITEKVDIVNLARRQKTIISATSEDKEVLTLLRTLADYGVKPSSPFDNIIYETESGAKLVIANGGFPFNFDRRPWNVPAHDIELTQGLMLISCMEGQLRASKPADSTLTCSNRYMLSPTLQRLAVDFWQKRHADGRYPEELLTRDFQSIEWIKSQSGNGLCHTATEELFSDVASITQGLATFNSESPHL